uniref:Uncharacterized protein n=1 Tax=Nelumbo nucifera TaxID=4432 RepID=A0A822Z6A1_NELNU|nr:TPA_asm: hypothetical protein HUJ06_014690 [Nelumbo nucifera]
MNCSPPLFIVSFVEQRRHSSSLLWDPETTSHPNEMVRMDQTASEMKDTTTSPLCWTAGVNTVVSDQDQQRF